MAMAIYALVIATLINVPTTPQRFGMQIMPMLEGLLVGFCLGEKKLVEYGPQFGHFPKASKSSVIVKAVLK